MFLNGNSSVHTTMAAAIAPATVPLAAPIPAWVVTAIPITPALWHKANQPPAKVAGPCIAAAMDPAATPAAPNPIPANMNGAATVPVTPTTPATIPAVRRPVKR